MRNLLLSLLAFSASQAWAAGFEKSIMWGGRSAGLAGIATPYVQGSQALYFNPAGLVSDQQGMDISFNISPTSSQFSGPINTQNEVTDSRQDLSLPLGLLYSNTISDQWGYGAGFYVSGGSHAVFDEVDFPGATKSPNVKTDLRVVEFALGTGYKVDSQWKVGLAYRVVMASGSFAFVDRPGGAFVFNTEVNDVSDVNFASFKLGAQYRFSENTQWGLALRSASSFAAEGKFGGALIAPISSPIDENDATVKTEFPLQVTLGMEHDLNPNWKLFAEYAWTQYSAIDEIEIEGTLSRAGGTLVQEDPVIEMGWKDQHNMRLAAEFLGLSMPLRFGYGYTSQVTASDKARASFTAPGMAHTLTVGTGMPIGTQFQFDSAIEYTLISGEGEGAAAGTTAGNSRAGDYTTNAIALHLGFSAGF